MTEARISKQEWPACGKEQRREKPSQQTRTGPGNAAKQIEIRKRRNQNLLVNPIGVVLRLNGHTAAPDHLLIDPLNALGALEVGRAIHPVARVKHDARLISPQLRFDTRELARQGRHHRILGRVLDEEVAVVPLARAVGPAVALEAGLVARMAESQVRGGGKVVDGVGLGGQDLAGRERVLVGLEVALGVGQGELVVPDEGLVGVAEGVEVEVGVVREKEG